MNKVSQKPARVFVEEAAMKPYPKIIFVIVIFCLFLAGCGSAAKGVAPTPENGGAQDFGAVISATGVVVPEHWAALSARSQAVVAEVLVTEGERVPAGRSLVRLDGQAAAQAKLSAVQYELINAQQALDTLKNEADVERARVLQAVANAMQAVHDAQEDVDKLTYRRASDDLITQTQDEIDLAKKQISRAEDAYKLVKHRPEGDSQRAAAELALVKARIHLDNRISYLNWYTGKPDDIDAAKYRAALEVAQADLNRFKAEYDRRKDGPDTKLLAQAEARLNLAKAQVLAAEEDVVDLELRAPFEGVVCNLDVRVGEWVTPGVPIIQLGDLGSLRVETTDLSEIDAARIHSQDVSDVTFDALPDVTVKGTVHWVASKSAEGSGVNYTAVILLDTIPTGLRWGMTAFADIKVSE
jgi:HlyD family secretion protein